MTHPAESVKSQELTPLAPLAAQLELASTLVYIDREAVDHKRESTIKDLARRVKEIKPHFSDQTILDRAKSLRSDGLLNSNTE